MKFTKLQLKQIIQEELEGYLNEEEKWTDALLPQWVKDLKHIELQRCVQKEMGHPAAQCPDKDLEDAAKAQIAVKRVAASPQSATAPTETTPTAQLEQIIKEEMHLLMGA